MFCLLRWWGAALAPLFLLDGQVLAAPDVPLRLEEDTTSTVQEKMWFTAEAHIGYLTRVAEQMATEITPWAHCLDCFGASESVRRCWQNANFRATSLDVKLAKHHDIAILDGCVELIRLALSLFSEGIIVAGPPCSLQVAASQSVHQRSLSRPMGNTDNFRTRVSNRIWVNFGICLLVIWRIRQDLKIVLEQPSSSWAYKMPIMKQVIQEMALKKLTTWMGCFGHDLAKCTHLLVDFRSADGLSRKMTKSMRLKIKARFQRRQDRRDVKKVYYTTSADGKWSGGRNLPDSAAYTGWFCRAVLKAWLRCLTTLQLD